ncbi:MAG: HD domain-containing protein [Desulfobacteraceae bacterium]|nr:MAG: HD domain-containing protein [Desulfobacteraceae bacterium]
MHLSPCQTAAGGPVVAADDLLSAIRSAAGRILKNSRGSHDWEHTLRVHALCRRIGPVEGADMQVLEAAAYLHDIGRADQDASRGALCHAALGAEKARGILDALPLDKPRRDNIVHCVRTHRFRDDHTPATLEARVLFDADKLDAIGAVGVARAYLFAGELGACLHNPNLPPEACRSYSRDDTGYREFAVKLSKIKDRMITAEGRRLAEERHAFMAAFFERFLEEYAGRK